MFDAPEAIQSIGERSRTTLPTQALALMNSPFVRRCAEKLAGRLDKSSLAKAIDDAYRITLTRLPSPAERDRMLTFVQHQAESHGKTSNATDLALADFCQLLLCLNEFVYVD